VLVVSKFITVDTSLDFFYTFVLSQQNQTHGDASEKKFNAPPDTVYVISEAMSRSSKIGTIKREYGQVYQHTVTCATTVNLTKYP